MARARRVTRWAAAVGMGVSLAASARAATAQTPPASGAGRPSREADVPPAYRPPPGMCRVWLAGVPPNQQPAPTDCASAVRNRPANGRVLFGDDYVGRKTGTLSPSSPFTLVAYSPPAARPTAQDEYEAGYAAGYRDAMNGRRPRFRGAGITAVPSGSGAAPGYGSGGYGGGYGDAPLAGGTAGGGGVVVIPPSQDPRYYNNGRYSPPGRANGVCLDRDGDGWCDDPRFGAPVCRDLDGDGRCDDYPALAAAPFPNSLPEMRAGIDVQQGRGSATALRWLGTSEIVARVVGPSRSGSPRRVLWFDANTNQLLQSWTDLDGDGVADRVEIFRNGRRVKLLGR